MVISFTVYGEPVAQGRPRFARRGSFVTAYDPKKSRDYKDTVYSVAVDHRPDKPLDGQLEMTVKIYRSIPKSFSKRKAADAVSGLIRPVTKPDVDNYIKGVKDACKGIIWVDDSQVVTISASKYYSFNPRVEITVIACGGDAIG